MADTESTMTEVGEEMSTSFPRLKLVGAVALVVIILDQVTKIWAVATLEDRDIDLVWTARFHLIRNTGSAFGIGKGLGRWLVVAIVIVIGFVLVYALRTENRFMRVLFGAIVGGAIGNLIDRLFRADDGFLSGGVIDFIDLQWWPVFNIADIAVVCGAIGLMLLSMREPT